MKKAISKKIKIPPQVNLIDSNVSALFRCSYFSTEINIKNKGTMKELTGLFLNYKVKNHLLRSIKLTHLKK